MWNGFPLGGLWWVGRSFVRDLHVLEHLSAHVTICIRLCQDFVRGWKEVTLHELRGTEQGRVPVEGGVEMLQEGISALKGEIGVHSNHTPGHVLRAALGLGQEMELGGRGRVDVPEETFLGPGSVLAQGPDEVKLAYGSIHEEVGIGAGGDTNMVD